MKNKFEKLIPNKIIWRIMLASQNIKIEDTPETAIKIFNELDEKYRFHKNLSILIKENKKNIPKAFNEILQNIHKLKVNEKFNLDLIKIIFRSYSIKDEIIKDENVTLLDSPKEKHLFPLSFTQFMEKTEKKKYYVKNMFASGTINMIFSPPKQMKSFVSYYLALCMATGKDFLGQKTNKNNVCYFDWENPISDVQNRINGICEGMKFKKDELGGLFFFPRQTTLIKVDKYESYVYDYIKEELLEFIKENDIKIIFFDTFRRLGNFDENDSQTINTIKSQLFDPLIKESNVCIIFLHHTSKEGKTYRGSVDIEGILDTSFKITKKELEDDIQLTITCDARRNNEIDCIKSLVEIENKELEDDDGDMYEEIEKVRFKRMEINEIEETANDYKLYRSKMIERLEINTEYRNKELKEILEIEFKIGSDRTISKILKWMVDVNILIKKGEFKSTRYFINPELKKPDIVKEIFLK